MTRTLHCLAILALLSGTAADAQEMPTVPPGGVATVTVQAPPAAAGRAYRIEAAPGVRLFTRAAGTLAAAGAAPVLLPLTLGVAADQPAGELVAARVIVDAAEAGPDTLEARVRVERRARLELLAEAQPAEVEPGERARVRYRVVNRGNAVDTVAIRADPPSGWGVAANPPSHVLAAGAEAAGVVELVTSETAQPGDILVVPVRAVGRAAEDQAAVRIGVGTPGALIPGLVQIPATLFLGYASPESGGLDERRLGVAFAGAGEILPETELSFSFRRRPPAGTPPVLVGALGGPELRVGLRRGPWQAEAGQVHTIGSALAGSFLHGAGVDLRWSESGRAAELFAARPLASAGDGGYMLMTRGELEPRPERRLELSFTAMREPTLGGGPAPAAEVAALGVELGGVTGSRLDAEAGLVRATTPSGDRVIGPALDAAYALRAEGGVLTGRVRWLPATPPSYGTALREASAGGTLRLVGPVGLLGRAFALVADPHGFAKRIRSRGAALGLGAEAGKAQLELLGSLERSSGYAWLEGPSRRRTVRAALALPLGPVHLDTRAEHGRLETGESVRKLRDYSAALRWHGGRGWAWVGGSYTAGEFGAPLLRVDLGGSLHYDRFSIDGGLGGWWSREGLPASFHAWSGVRAEITRDLALRAGVEHRPFPLDGVAGWTTSFGIEHRLPLPLPIRPPALAHGVLFEDLDGDRRPDPDEPRVSGVRLTLGPGSEVTGPEGEFRFEGGTGAGFELRVDAATLPAGFIVPPDVHVRSTGRVDIPIVSTATLTVRAFLDRDGDGIRDEGEEPAKEAVVRIVGPLERARDALTDRDGVARFPALLPGSYTVTVRAADAAGLRQEEVTVETRVDSGAEAAVDVAAPYREREIRFR